MSCEIIERVVAEGNFVIEHNATIRAASKVFGVSKSTLHIDLTKRLAEIDRDLSERVKKVLEYNWSVRHLRGGESTRRNCRAKRKSTTSVL